MPELPEVETTRRALIPHLSNVTCSQVVVRQAKLRLPFPTELSTLLPGQTLSKIERRAKYLLLHFDLGVLILHLGMSGSIKIIFSNEEPNKHEHYDLIFTSADDKNVILRYRDPRRFGMVQWWAHGLPMPTFLKTLGPEPLDDGFNGEWLWAQTRQSTTAIKPWLMDGHHVVGIGNIYAQESLFRAAIHPARTAQSLSQTECDELVIQIKQTLNAAIAAGGSSLRDFVHIGGEHGWFQQTYFVYGREGGPCRHCGAPIERRVQAQRTTCYCPVCQPRY